MKICGSKNFNLRRVYSIFSKLIYFSIWQKLVLTCLAHVGAFEKERKNNLIYEMKPISRNRANTCKILDVASTPIDETRKSLEPRRVLCPIWSIRTLLRKKTLLKCFSDWISMFFRIQISLIGLKIIWAEKWSLKSLKIYNYLNYWKRTWPSNLAISIFFFFFDRSLCFYHERIICGKWSGV